MIQLHNIHKSYGDLQVLKGIDLTIEAGSIVSIVGASGSGKTTLLHIMGTLDRPDSNRGASIEFDGVALQSMKDKALAHFRNQNMGFVFQFHQLLPEFSALENVCMPGIIAGKSVAELEPRAVELLTELNLQDRVHRKPDALSGGEQQRVAVARALMNNPKIILADEPSGNLDSKGADALHQLFLDLRDRYNQTFVIVTHNPELAAMADVRLTMQDGQLLHD